MVSAFENRLPAAFLVPPFQNRVKGKMLCEGNTSASAWAADKRMHVTVTYLHVLQMTNLSPGEGGQAGAAAPHKLHSEGALHGS